MPSRHRFLVRERFHRRHRHVVTVHLEEPAQLLARVGAAEAIGAEHEIVVCRQESADLIGKDLHVVGRRRHRTGTVLEALLDVTQTRLRLGMQHVPALRIEPLAAQLIETGDAPDVGRDAEILFEELRSGDHLAQDGAAAQELDPGLLRLRFALAEQIHALEYAFFHAFRHRRMGIILVHHRDVVVDILLLLIHPAQPVLDDHRQLIGERRVVRDALGDARREDVAVSVFVLQPLAVERGASRRAADQEAARAHVARGPRQVAHALKPEHRIKGVERNHRYPVGAVGRRGGDPRRHCAGFGDALLQNLAVFVLLVEHELVGVLRGVYLTDVGIDAKLPEHAFHPESARLIRDDRHHELADFLVADDGVKDAHKRHRCRNLASFGASELGLECRKRRRFERRGLAAARGQQAPHRFHPLHEIFHFR